MELTPLQKQRLHDHDERVIKFDRNKWARNHYWKHRAKELARMKKYRDKVKHLNS